MLRLLDLFSGIGGFSLAASWTGQIETVAFVEIDPFCQKVLQKNFPGVPIHGDIKTFTYTESGKTQSAEPGGLHPESCGKDTRDTVDIICGGFPCQPASVAGNRKGTADDRWLWPEMLRVITEVKPTWLILENVPGLLTLEQGLVFEKCCLALESEDYEVQPFIIPACAVNAPHRRDRVWIVAHNERMGWNEGFREGIQSEEQESEGQNIINIDSKEVASNTTNSKSTELSSSIDRQKQKEFRGGYTRNYWGETNWFSVATEFCRMDNGLPIELDRLKLSKSRHRTERLKALGNAIVPQVAYQIFKAIVEVEDD